MNILKLSWKNILHQPLSAILSIILLAFGTGIISLLISGSSQFEEHFNRNIKSIDMVVGAKGSPLQLILASIYHIDAPTGNIPVDEYEKLLKNPLVAQGIPLAFGDSYKGYRIVGTEHSYLELYEGKLENGENWKKDGDVVIGAKAAELLNLKVGDHFHGQHGLHDEAHVHDELSYQVVGILEANGTVLDKLILTSVESVWAVHHPDNHQQENKEITSALIKFRSPMGNLSIPRMVNQKTSMQAALPAIEINRLFSLMDSVIKALQFLAYLIVAISAISVFISLFQNLRNRKYELALLRSLGASRWQLFLLMILQGIIISFIGYVVGIIFAKIGLWLISYFTFETYKFEMEIFYLTSADLILFGFIIFIGFLAALIPSISAFRLNISKTLSDA